MTGVGVDADDSVRSRIVVEQPGDRVLFGREVVGQRVVLLHQGGHAVFVAPGPVGVCNQVRVGVVVQGQGEPYPPGAGLREVAEQETQACVVVRVDPRVAPVRLRWAASADHRYATLAQDGAHRVVRARFDVNDAVHRCVQPHPRRHRTRHHLEQVAALVRRRHGTQHQLCVVRDLGVGDGQVAVGRQGQAEHSGATAGQGPGRAGRGVAEFGRRGQYTLPGRLGQPPGAVERVRHRGRGHPGMCGHGIQRGTPPDTRDRHRYLVLFNCPGTACG